MPAHNLAIIPGDSLVRTHFADVWLLAMTKRNPKTARR
jgi:hypothetical protein